MWGSYNVVSTCRAKYFLTILDEYSRSVWIYLLVKKRETNDILKKILAMVYPQFHKKVKTICTDNGTEFVS